MLKLFMIIALYITSMLSNAQENTVFYKFPDGKAITQKQLDKRIKQYKNIAKQVHQDAKVQTFYADTLVKQDSTIVATTIELMINGEILSPSKEQKNGVRDQLLNKAFPDFNLANLQDKKVSFEKYKGKPVMINFWFKNCAPCIDEIPALNKLKEKYQDKVHFVAITFNTKAEVTTFLKTHEFNFEHLIDAKDFCDELSINAYPLNLFINSTGKVVSVENGIPYMMDESGNMKPGDETYFEEIINKML